jgi:signal transduction histidine kinase
VLRTSVQVPTIQLGEGPAVVTIADVIRAQQAEILARWTVVATRAASARGLSQPEFRNIMPGYLDALAEGSAGRPAQLAHIHSHVATRIRQGFDLAEILDEFAILGRCIAQGWAGLPAAEAPSPEESEALAEELHRAGVAVIDLFQEHMTKDEQHEKRYLRLLQTIADEAIRSEAAPLGTRLREVLELIMEAMEAQTAAICLFDAVTRRLVVASSAGRAEQELGRQVSNIGAGTLEGAIAEREVATAVEDVATTTLDVSEALRKSGIHAVLGVRLPPRHSLVGILYIGLEAQRSFSPRELRRLEALGDKLTLHLDSARLYAELRSQVRALSREQEVREAFVTVLAHDLRGPLSATWTVAELLARHPEALGERRDLALLLQRNLSQMDRMIRNLLDVGRTQSGKELCLHLEPCDLGAIATEVIEELRVVHGDRFVVSAEHRVVGVWSADDLRRTVWNLAENAVKYGAADRPVTVRIETIGNGARLSVHNDGPPLSPAALERLFEPFMRGGREGAAGWGLGLSAVRACANAHGGTIEVSSNETEGTTFVLTLPKDVRDRALRPASPPQAVEGSQSAEVTRDANPAPAH